MRSGLSGWTRWRISAVFVVFEGGMPLAGLAVGTTIGHTVGGVAGYLSGALLVLLGGYLWWADDDNEAGKVQRLTSARGIALLGLVLSISLDELAIGFSLGLGADLTAPTTIVTVLAIQTLIVSQLGLSLGARVSERMREGIERVTGPILMSLGAYLIAEALIRIELLTNRDAVIVGSLSLIMLGASTIYRRHATRRQPPLPYHPAPNTGRQ